MKTLNSQPTRQSTKFLMPIGGRNYLLTSLAAAVTDQMRLIYMIAPDIVPALPFPDRSKDLPFRERIVSTNESLFRNLDAAISVLRGFVGKDIGEEFFADLNYCFLILFRHAGLFAQGDPLACAYNRYQEMCSILRSFQPRGENWNTLRGAYDEFKESTTAVVSQLAEINEKRLSAEQTADKAVVGVKVGAHCSAFLTYCNRNYGSIILGKRNFHIPASAAGVWAILEMLIAAVDPEGFVCLGDSRWQGLFSRTDKENNRVVKCGCMQILKYIHPRHRGRGNGGWYRLMPYPKQTRTGDGTLPPDV